MGAFRPTHRGGLTSNNLERGEHAEMYITEREFRKHRLVHLYPSVQFAIDSAQGQFCSEIPIQFELGPPVTRSTEERTEEVRCAHQGTVGTGGAGHRWQRRCGDATTSSTVINSI
ncbi:hypothetical protein NQZ68_042261 [Dissostichus eleginoides]|nr:hypothetical protein NQZ68_042261 [Dissostichus eleginoides]